MRRLVRLLTKVGVAAVAGAGVTWGVAWGCVVWSPRPALGACFVDSGAEPSWIMRQGGSRGVGVVWSQPFEEGERRWLDHIPVTGGEGTGVPSWSRPARISRDDVLSNEAPRAYRRWQLYEVGAGWPLHCLRGAWVEEPETSVGWEVTFPGFSRGAARKTIVTKGIGVPAWGAGASPVLPTVPIWPGFATNVVVNGLLVVVVYVGARAGARVMRGMWRSEVRCARCAYSRVGLPVDAACPECGMVPSSAPLGR